MNRARYRFETNKRYLAWVVAATLMELPSICKLWRAIKIILATPYIIESGGLSVSETVEAVVWIIWSAEDEIDRRDAKFTQDAGIVIKKDGSILLPKNAPQLSCAFSSPHRDSGFQVVSAWQVVPRGKFGVSSRVLQSTPGIKLDHATNSASRSGKKQVFGTKEFQILQSLYQSYPTKVSLAQLRDDVDGWDLAKDSTIAQAIHAVKKKLEQLGCSITTRSGVRGWALIDLIETDKTRIQN